jgi:hypothetical protein
MGKRDRSVTEAAIKRRLIEIKGSWRNVSSDDAYWLCASAALLQYSKQQTQNYRGLFQSDDPQDIGAAFTAWVDLMPATYSFAIDGIPLLEAGLAYRAPARSARINRDDNDNQD